MTIETMSRRISYCYVQYKYMRYWSVLDVTIYWVVSELVIVFMLLKVIEKILSDRNTYIVLLSYRLYGNIVHIIIITSLILLLSSYHSSNRNDMNIDWSK